jgi:hypothetical protein
MWPDDPGLHRVGPRTAAGVPAASSTSSAAVVWCQYRRKPPCIESWYATGWFAVKTSNISASTSAGSVRRRCSCGRWTLSAGCSWPTATSSSRLNGEHLRYLRMRGAKPAGAAPAAWQAYGRCAADRAADSATRSRPRTPPRMPAESRYRAAGTVVGQRLLQPRGHFGSVQRPGGRDEPENRSASRVRRRRATPR